jgi:hypothetical protein
MGWTCQHDHKGYCKLLNTACVPGIKGCTINKNADGVIFSSGNYEDDKKAQEDKQNQEIDFAALARSN